MVKRIAYKKKNGEEGGFISNNYTASNGAVYSVEINIITMTYRVKNVTQRKIVRSNEIDKVAPPKHTHTLKVHAKNALKKMGVKFELEIKDIKP